MKYLSKIKALIQKLSTSSHTQVLAGNLATAALGFLTFWYLARHIPAQDFGEWLIFLTAFNFMEMVRTGFIRQALVREFAAAREVWQQKQVIASAWCLGFILTTGFSLILLLVYPFSSYLQASPGWMLFSAHYPWLVWLTLPLSMATFVYHAKQSFLKMVTVPFLQTAVFLVILLSSSLGPAPLFTLFTAYVLTRLGVLLTGLVYIRDWWARPDLAQRQKIQALFQFGKYSLGTLLGTNLLRSADIFLISFFMGPVAVARYAVPVKFIELVSIPLRSFTMVAYPKFCQLFAEGKTYLLWSYFVKQVSRFSVLMIPGLILAVLFREQIVVLLGGETYRDTSGILLVFLIFLLFLPLDRFTGVLLDSMSLPQLNTLKVSGMVLVNILGDLLVLFFYPSLEAVAAVTVANVLVGIIYVMYYIHRRLRVSPTWELNLHKSRLPEAREI